MAIYETYTKRQKRLRGDVPDVYTYNDLPEVLAVQITYIWEKTLGNDHQFVFHKSVTDVYRYIVETLRCEYGVYELPNQPTRYRNRQNEYKEELWCYFLGEMNIEGQLDAIELSFRMINKFTRSFNYLSRGNADSIADNAIAELNQRFKEHGIGFQFVENEILKIDSDFIHSQAVIPALRLLNTKYYEGAQHEFLLAHEHYRHGRYKECLNECLKAFESTMKSICNKQGWQYPGNITSKGLIAICFEKNLVPSFWQHQMTSLKGLLESTIPTGRNKLSGHGQGSELIEIPEHIVAYMLHMTASTLVFLTKAELQLEQNL